MMKIPVIGGVTPIGEVCSKPRIGRFGECDVSEPGRYDSAEGVPVPIAGGHMVVGKLFSRVASNKQAEASTSSRRRTM